MHYSYDSPYPPLYVPDPYRTTYIPHHRITEVHHHHHYPLEHFRHALGHTISNVADGFAHPFGSHDTVRLNPVADVTETEKGYVIDVELPGLEREEEVRLDWVWRRTLLVEARVERSGVEVGEGDKEGKEIEGGDGGMLMRTPSREDVPPLGTIPAESGDGKAKKINAGINGEDDTTKKQERDARVALTVHERRIGLFTRAFSFPTAVNQEKVEMSLRAGVLRLRVSKMEEEEGEGKGKVVKGS